MISRVVLVLIVVFSVACSVVYFGSDHAPRVVVERKE